MRLNGGGRERNVLGFGTALVATSIASRPSAAGLTCTRQRAAAGAAPMPGGGGGGGGGSGDAMLVTMMADISKSRPGVGGPKGPAFSSSDGGGGGVAVITKPTTKQKTKRKEKTEHEPSWRVLLHNDDVHTFDYVTGAIVKVRCPTFTFTF